MRNEKKFYIMAPAGSIYLSLAVGIVYGERVGFETLFMLFVIGTIFDLLGLKVGLE